VLHHLGESFRDERDQTALGQHKRHEQLPFGAKLDSGPEAEPLEERSCRRQVKTDPLAAIEN
jgi:hypothetical protein